MVIPSELNEPIQISCGEENVDDFDYNTLGWTKSILSNNVQSTSSNVHIIKARVGPGWCVRNKKNYSEQEPIDYPPGLTDQEKKYFRHVNMPHILFLRFPTFQKASAMKL